MGSTAVTSEAAQAQNSSGFAEAYQPVAEMVNAQPANYEGARAAIPTVVAAIENENDRQVAGNLILNIGNNLSDPALQRRGLQMMLDSGLVAPEQVGQFNWFVGSLAYQADDWAAARAAFEAARAAGYSDPEADLVSLIADTYGREGNEQAGLDYRMQAIADAEAAGNTPNEGWILSALQSTYDNDMSSEAIDVSEALLRHYPTQTNWVNTLQVVNALYEFEPEARVDLFRLMRVTDALTQRPEFVRYIEDLDPRVMSNEVQKVLARGTEEGVFTADDPYYVEVKGIADTRAPQDRSGIDTIVSDGRSGDGLDAIGAGDVLYSLDDFAQAEELYSTALDKGYDANVANTRIGIAQAQQGNYAAAIETFAKVDGTREPIARMWAAYAASMM
ncbi:tetratricopeptide repeat protein [Aurantiacibacter hainanensis]|uniref:tetratricopeptide repeat protein n=1 Tax=Aurantiacibacter hainanensis TaxID=3076114 RepID=UPI0030C71B36